jgi:hypothetical protein
MSSWMILMLVVLVLAALVLALAWAIQRNMREGERFRDRLADRLVALRLERLMGLLGLDPNQYLHSERIVDVERHLRNCAGCPETERCDQALAQEKPDAIADTCPNYEDLQALRGRRAQDKP